jgi:hypothetical protein
MIAPCEVTHPLTTRSATMTRKHHDTEPGFFTRIAQQLWNHFRKDSGKKIAGAASEVCNLCSHLEPKAPALTEEAAQRASRAGESWVARTMASTATLEKAL